MRFAILFFCAMAALFAESVAGVKRTTPAGWTSKGASPMRAATYIVQDADARWRGQLTHNGAPAPSFAGE